MSEMKMSGLTGKCLTDECVRTQYPYLAVGGDVAQLLEHQTSTPLVQVRLLVWQGILLPESTFSADSYGVHTFLCAVACIKICAHVKDPVVYVTVRWIMKHQNSHYLMPVW